jgi:arylsulfatase A-like enzyme
MKTKKLFGIGWAVVLVAGTALGSRGQQAPKRPNVLIILTDDQGYGDFSCNGNPVLETPALDSLQAGSIRFSNFHVAPLCTPSRGELMSGMDALHNRASTVGTGRGILRRDIVTLPALFARNGYRTGIFGKWHLGDDYPDRPMDRGFEKCIWFRGWGLLSESEYDNDYYHTRYLDSLTPVRSQLYCTDLWFRKAMQWMGKMHREGRPFFAYLATNAPPGPFDAPRGDFAYYRDKVSDRKAARFFGMIRDIDRNMGQLEKWLVREHLRDNTLVIFMNDNGGTGGVQVYNAGMRGKKGSNYDGGHRAVCFLRWPAGGLGGARTITSPAEIQDILPTCAALCSLRLPPHTQLDGRSLAPLLHGVAPSAHRMFVVQYGGSVRPEKYFSCVVRDNWRLVGTGELYDLETDPGESRNVAAQNPDLLRTMRTFYDAWWEKNGPPAQGFLPLFIGAGAENPVTLTSGFWGDSSYVNTQWKVAAAGGPPAGGLWHVKAVRGGTYRFELSRWPFELRRPLTAAGPAFAEGGTRLRTGRAVAVRSACLSIDGKAPLAGEKKDSGATEITVQAALKPGLHTLQGWFRDGGGTAVCGAYYLRVTRLSPSR